MTSLFIEMAQAVGAEKGEQAEGRITYWSDYYTPKLGHPSRKTRARSPQAYRLGKIKAISEELYGHDTYLSLTRTV